MIPSLSFIIAICGGLMLLILAARINEVNKESKLKKHRSKNEGLADLLKYAAMVDDGIIVNKNGSFMAAWLYKGEDNASSTDEQRNMVSFRINQALAGLGNGWMVHVDAARRPAPAYSNPDASEFADPVSAAIDEERRRFFESRGVMFEGYFVITVTYFPPLLAQTKFAELMFDDDTPVLNKNARTHALIDNFKRDVEGIENRLSAGLHMERLKGEKVTMEDGSEVTHDNFLRWLQFCITGINQPVILPSNPIYLDSLIGGQEMYTGTVARIGQKFVQVVAITGLPTEKGTSPGMLTLLGELPVEYRWSTRFIFLDEHESLNYLGKFRKKWKQKVRGFFDQVFNTNSGQIDQDALSAVHDSDSAIAEIKSKLVAPGFYTSVVVLMDENRDKLAEACQTVKSAIEALGMSARIETINTVDAYFGSLPGDGECNVRRPHMHTMNLADLMPVSTIWTGDETAPCPLYPAGSPAILHTVTNGNSPFRFNFHVADLGHAIVFGPTRAGKSTFLALLATQLRRYARMRVFAFDKGMSMYAICKATRGTHYSVAGDGDTLAFCPLQYLSTKSDRAWAMEWIDTILALNGINTSPEQRNEIGRTILTMHNTESKTLSDFQSTVQDEAIREALMQYTVAGSMGHLLDAEEDGLTLNDFTTFEIAELMGLSEKYALPVLLYLFRRIERSLDGSPTVLFLDEAWLMLDHPVFRAKIREWLKAFAKMNVSVVMATQNLSDAAKSGILDVIMESTATKVFLPNLHAREEDTAALYRRMGLNPRQIEVIATARAKRDYYAVSEKGHRLFQLALGPLALSFVAAGDQESLNTIRTLEAMHGEGWVTEWLKQKRINLTDYGRALQHETV
jgi:type IV secretion system protein TrbE